MESLMKENSCDVLGVNIKLYVLLTKCYECTKTKLYKYSSYALYIKDNFYNASSVMPIVSNMVNNMCWLTK